jgi:hypothetical protein
LDRRFESHREQWLQLDACESNRMNQSSSQVIELEQSMHSLRARVDSLGSEIRTVGTTCIDAVSQLQCQIDRDRKATGVQDAASSAIVHAQGSDVSKVERLDLSMLGEKGSLPKDVESLLFGAIPDLQGKVQDLQSMQCSCYKKLGESLDSHEMSIKLLLSRLDNLYERQSETEMQRLHLLSDSQRNLRRGLHENSDDTLSKVATPQTAVTSEQMAAVQEHVDSQRARLEVLASEIRVVGSACNDAVVQLQQHVQRTLDQANASHQDLAGESVLQENSVLTTFNAEVLPELANELKVMRSELSALHDKVEEQIVFRSLQIDHQMPEARRQIERLSNDSVTIATKVEEHEVRLGLAWTKQLANEEKIHGCMARLEQQPGVAKLRSICREELDATDAVTNYAALAKRLELTMDAVAELGDRLQSQEADVSKCHTSDTQSVDGATVLL